MSLALCKPKAQEIIQDKPESTTNKEPKLPPVEIVPAQEVRLPSKPPNFPKLPSNYTEWFGYISYYDVEDSPCFDDYNVELKTVEDTFNPPYTIRFKELNYFWGEVDSLFGQLNYYSDSNCTSLSIGGTGAVFIIWYPHQEIGDTNVWPFYEYGPGFFNFIAHEKEGIEVINIGGRKALRLRGKWWDTQCDDIFHSVGSFTTYLIPTGMFDFRISCLSSFYTRNPHYYPEGVSYDEQVPEDWTYEKKGPDRIRELEQAVEQTFRVKQ